MKSSNDRFTKEGGNGQIKHVFGYVFFYSLAPAGWFLAIFITQETNMA